MSITVSYHGRMSETVRLQELKEEFEDIARTNGWPHELVNGEYEGVKKWNAKAKSQDGTRVQTLSPPLHLKGIKIIVHPQTDPLWLTFDKQGDLTQLSYYPLDH